MTDTLTAPDLFPVEIVTDTIDSPGLDATGVLSETMTFTSTLDLEPMDLGFLMQGPLLASSASAFTIRYKYDPLYRLTAADYSDNSSYHYVYDAVGNRLSQTIRTSHGIESSTTYDYDRANRLAHVGTAALQWDANGNMQSDGSGKQYTYDKANRLKSVTGTGLNLSYTYNGQGDRTKQIINGTTTNYLLDLNADLTQVLSDGTKNYLYGVGRIGEASGTNWSYYQGDALGSVRQLSNATTLTMNRNYTPYGEVLSSAGSGSTNYGFTGEWTDNNTNFINLRARYYSPSTGRFISRDMWGGDPNKPMSYNSWLFVEDNTINYIDPTGYIKQGAEEIEANKIVKQLKDKGIYIYVDWFEPTEYNPNTDIWESCGWNQGAWELYELKVIEQAVNDLDGNNGLNGKIKSAIVKVTIQKGPKFGNSTNMMAPPGILSNVLGNIQILGNVEKPYEDWFKFSIVHELAHNWDYRTGKQLSFNLMKELKTWVCVKTNFWGTRCHWDPYNATVTFTGKVLFPEPPPDTVVGCETTPPGPNNPNVNCRGIPYSSTYGNGGPIFTGPGMEDWAQSLAFFIYRNYEKNSVIGLKPGSIREQYVQKQISKLP